MIIFGISLLVYLVCVAITYVIWVVLAGRQIRKNWDEKLSLDGPYAEYARKEAISDAVQLSWLWPLIVIGFVLFWPLHTVIEKIEDFLVKNFSNIGERLWNYGFNKVDKK